MVRKILERLLSRISVPDTYEKRRTWIANRVRYAGSSAEMYRLSDEIAMLINEVMEDNGAPRSDSDQEILKDFLIEVLGSGTFPDSVAKDAIALKSVVEGLEGSKGLTKEVLLEASNLIKSARTESEKEKTVMSGFLVRLGIKIKDLEETIKGVQVVADTRRGSLTKLDQSVMSGLDGINKTIEDSNLKHVGAEIALRIDGIQNALSDYKEREQLTDENFRDEIGRLQKKISKLEAEACETREELKKQRLQAMTDPLTGMPNRLAFEQGIEVELEKFEREQVPCALIVLDIDRFKSINDTYGHKAGDEVLRKVSQVMAGEVRKSDLVSRFGGEEFVVVLPGATQENAMQVAEKIRTTLEKTQVVYNEHKITVTASMGVCGAMQNRSANRMFELADAALYAAKESGRNRCVANGEENTLDLTPKPGRKVKPSRDHEPTVSPR